MIDHSIYKFEIIVYFTLKCNCQVDRMGKYGSGNEITDKAMERRKYSIAKCFGRLSIASLNASEDLSIVMLNSQPEVK